MFGFDTVIVQERTSAGVCGSICKFRVLLLSLYRLNKISPDFRIQPAKYILQVSRIDVRGNGNVDVRESVIFKMVGTHLF